MKIEQMKKEKEKYIISFKELIAIWKFLNSLESLFTHKTLQLIQKDNKANQAYNHLITALSDYEDSIYKAIFSIYGENSELLSLFDNHSITEDDKNYIFKLLNDNYSWNVQDINQIEDLKMLIRMKRIPMWKIAETVGVSEPTITRWFRKPLTTDHFQKVMQAIKEIERTVDI